MFDLYIHSNLKNHIPAKVSEYSFRKHNPSLKTTIINLEDLSLLSNCHGKLFRRGNTKCKLNIHSSQSFFFVRFICTAIHNNSKNKWILIIDPDIFCLQPIMKDLNSYIISAEKQGKHIIAVKENNVYLSSFMLVNTEKITWSENYIVDTIFNKLEDGDNYMLLKKYNNVCFEIPNIFNSYDFLSTNTKCLHTSLTDTQPWKTGIRYRKSDLHNKIPHKNEPFDQIFQPHKDPNITNVFFSLFKEAYQNQYFNNNDIQYAIKNGNLRKDYNLINIPSVLS